MDTPAARDAVRPPLSEARIPDDVFAQMRQQNLARWPTGAGVDFEAAVERHKSLPRHKQLAWVMRSADAQRRCLTQPRGGFGTFELQKELMQILDRDGHADIVPTTTDSYTRNEQWQLAQKGIEETEKMGRSMLNGYPLVNYGVGPATQLVDAINKPAIMLTGTAMPKLTGEIGYAAGYSGYLGSGIAYTVSYVKELPVEEGIRNYQYLDRLVAMYQDAGVELHRRQPGFLTGTNIPPSIAIITCVLDCLLAAAQGVRNYGLEMGQTLHLVQDAAATVVCREMCREYLAKRGCNDVFTTVTLLHWMGAWPQDDAQSAALISYGGTLAAIAGAVSVTTKSTHEAFGIPTPQINAEGLRMTRTAIYLARNIRLDGLPDHPARGPGGRGQGAGDGRRRRCSRHGARVRSRRARYPVVAQPARERPDSARARRGRLPAHTRPRPDALPEGRDGTPRGKTAPARCAGKRALRPGTRHLQRLRNGRADPEALTGHLGLASPLSQRHRRGRCTGRRRCLPRSRPRRRARRRSRRKVWISPRCAPHDHVLALPEPCVTHETP
jgi:methylaspartate mutase epsilon subunit